MMMEEVVVARALRREPTRPFAYRVIGLVATIGRRLAVLSYPATASKGELSAGGRG